jgi:hypothetical protein
MWLYLLVSFGACEALLVLGLFVYWIIINIRKKQRITQSNQKKVEIITPLTIKGKIDGLSLEQPINDGDHAPVSLQKTDNKTEDDDWLNTGVTEVSSDIIKQENDDWLNTTVPEVPTNDYKRQDDDWLKAEINQSAETEDPPPPYQSLQDIITVKLVEEAVTESHALIDDITVKPVQEPVSKSHALIDDITVKPLEEAVNKSHALMDDITVKPLAEAVNKSHPLTDEISPRPVQNLVTETHVLMDEISIKASPGPVHIEYEILDDLITKSALYRTKKAKPSSDVFITNSLESPVETGEPANGVNIAKPVENYVEKTEPSVDAVIIDPVENSIEKPESVTTVSVNEITEFLKEKRNVKQTTIPSLATDSGGTPSLARDGEEKGKILGRVKNYFGKATLPRTVAKSLATMRILNKNEFYIRDTNLVQEDMLIKEPQIKGFTFKVVTTANELDELVDGGYNLVMNFGKIKRGLKKGMIVFFAFVDWELAAMGWACITEECKLTLREYPYDDDLDNQACIVGDWTNPKFRESVIFSYVKHKRQQLLKEKGFTFERSIAAESTMVDLRSKGVQEQFELTCKRRTYTNVSLPGILGVEFRKERSLNDADNRPLYQMITLLVLVLPSPPIVAD